MMCGLTIDKINELGGINQNKLLAYSALFSSATNRTNYNIDRCIVVPDFKNKITERIKFINKDYTSETKTREVKINQVDGIGMVLPSICDKNFIVRSAWIKGLLTPFDFVKFCKEKNIDYKIKDVYGKEHDIIKENIQIIFSESQFKMWEYYKDWDEYKKYFKECNCYICETNNEEDYIPDANFNYQFLQTLNLTNEEIVSIFRKEYERITDLTQNVDSMLKALGGDADSEKPYNKAISLYPELIRDGYSKNALKSMKKKLTLNAKSAKVKIKNKRLFVIPDMYAYCEFLFCGEENPKGLLKPYEVSCKVYKRQEKLDLLRSPSLYLEHAIVTVCHNPKVYEWFTTNGVYISCHDLVTRILQCDSDGDQLNVTADNTIITAAERNIKEKDIVPLYYDAQKAQPEILNIDTMFNGYKRAHEYSGIGQISNALTRLWNKSNPDIEAAAILAAQNNFNCRVLCK